MNQNRKSWDDKILVNLEEPRGIQNYPSLMNENDSDRQSYFNIGVEPKEKSSCGCGDTPTCLNQ